MHGAAVKVALSEQALERALLNGDSYKQIGRAFGVSDKTVQRRVTDLRKIHGAGWPVPVKTEPPKPRYRDDGRLDFAPAEILRKGRRRLAALIDSDDENVALGAIKLALGGALVSDEPPKLKTPRETLLADMRERVESARNTVSVPESGTPLAN